MGKIAFYKMSGSGNDFIIIDNTERKYDHLKTPDFISAVCRRKISVGADGLIFIEPSEKCDFSWRFFNSDGSEAEMCGNGGRCAARFAFIHGIADAAMKFDTIAGIIYAEVKAGGVKIQLPDIADREKTIELEIDGQHISVHCLNTGVPHAIIFVKDTETVDVKELGAKIRFHEYFQPSGTNVNFVSQGSENVLNIRTYERGVEDETFACGTGSVAAALVAFAFDMVQSPVELRTRGGDMLKVFADVAFPPFTTVCLEGGAAVVMEGHLWEETFITGSRKVEGEVKVYV